MPFPSDSASSALNQPYLYCFAELPRPFSCGEPRAFGAPEWSMRRERTARYRATAGGQLHEAYAGGQEQSAPAKRHLPTLRLRCALQRRQLAYCSVVLLPCSFPGDLFREPRAFCIGVGLRGGNFQFDFGAGARIAPDRQLATGNFGAFLHPP